MQFKTKRTMVAIQTKQHFDLDLEIFESEPFAVVESLRGLEPLEEAEMSDEHPTAKDPPKPWTAFGSASWNDICSVCQILTDTFWSFKGMKGPSVCQTCFDKVFDRKTGSPL